MCSALGDESAEGIVEIDRFGDSGTATEGRGGCAGRGAGGGEFSPLGTLVIRSGLRDTGRSGNVRGVGGQGRHRFVGKPSLWVTRAHFF
jgi:hypothetical protein